MRNNYKNKIISVAITVILCLSFSFSVSAQNSKAASQNILSGTIVSPRFTSIIYSYNNLTLNSGGKFTCAGKTEVQEGYDATVEVELQQHIDGSWTTIKSWQASDTAYAYVMKNKYVAKGYSYRLKTTHQAKKNGKIDETSVKYSDVIKY